jgi:gamma-glutamylcyclotransferase (GGCT)/AIG2-like uncharacterized protein YtfP
MEDFEFLGIASLSGYRFRMNKLGRDRAQVFANIQEEKTSTVYGYLYRITERAEDYLDKREGFPVHYAKKNVAVTMVNQTYPNVLVYIAQPAFINDNVRQVTPLYAKQLKRGSKLLPEPYRSYFLEEIASCGVVQPNREPLPMRKSSSISGEDQRSAKAKILYHYQGENTEFIRRNPEFYTWLREMAMFLGNDNSVVERVDITPEMFRVAVKLMEMAARDELDLGHMIPRGLLRILQDSLIQMQASKEAITNKERRKGDE